MKVASIQCPAKDWEDAAVAWQTVKDMMIEAARDHDFVIVPESVYPAYFLPTIEEAGCRPVDEILDEVASIAKQWHCYIAFGYAKDRQNRASLFGPTGQEIAQKSKSYLWHFDRRWFESGEEVVVAETNYGSVALVVCADARLPELVRCAALFDVRLIVDLANLTASGPVIGNLTNAQCEFLLGTRAKENGVWLAVADKWGVEADTVTYAGRSAVYSPDGACLAQAPSDETTILSVDIPLDENGQISVARSHELPLRCPQLYQLLVKDTTELPMFRILSESVTPEFLTPYVTVSALNRTKGYSLPQHLRHLQRLVEHEADLVLLPTYPGEVDNIEAFQVVLSRDQVVVFGDIAHGVTRTRLFNRESILATYTTTHLESNSTHQLSQLVDRRPTPDNTAFPNVTRLPFGYVGAIHEMEGLLPEVSRCMMLAGTDFVVWQNGLPYAESVAIARTRAAESRIYVASVYSAAIAGRGRAPEVLADGSFGEGASFIVDPNGAVIASTLIGRRLQGTGAYCQLTTARSKSIVPGTHVLFDRKPKKYRRLVEHEHA